MAPELRVFSSHSEGPIAQGVTRQHVQQNCSLYLKSLCVCETKERRRNPGPQLSFTDIFPLINVFKLLAEIDLGHKCEFSKLLASFTQVTDFVSFLLFLV